MLTIISLLFHRRIQEFERGFFREFGDGSPPLGFSGRAPVEGLWDKSPEAGNILQIICGRKQNSICQFTIIVGSFVQWWEAREGGVRPNPTNLPLDPPLRWVVRWQTFENRTLAGEITGKSWPIVAAFWRTLASGWVLRHPVVTVQFREWQRVSSLGMFAVDEILPCYTRVVKYDASLHSKTLLIDNLLESA